jgi:membrane protein
MSLVYTTILSLVPLLAFAFSVLKGFGVHEKLELAVMRWLEPLGEQGIEIGTRIIQFVDNIKVGVLGAVGFALLLYTVISLMQKIESAFNFIWHVSQERSFAQRFSGYLTVVMIGPVLVFTSLGISATLLSSDIVSALAAIEPFGAAFQLATALLPFALVVAAFTFIYVFMPNTEVRVVSALAGALVAGLLWQFAGWGFASFVVNSAKYTAIYSAFAALIVFMLWLYVAWLVLLLGASVAFYHQNPDQIMRIRGELTLSGRLFERFSLAILAEIAVDFAAALPRPTIAEIAAKLDLPGVTTGRIVQALLRAELIICTNEDPPRWTLTRPAETISLYDALAAIRTDGEAGAMAVRHAIVTPAIDGLIEEADQGREDALAGRTLADLVETILASTPPPARVALLRKDRGHGTGE